MCTLQNATILNYVLTFYCFKIYPLIADGDVWLWGSNNKGQLGTGDTEARNFPHEAPSTFW